MDINWILQTTISGNMEHTDGAHLIEPFQLMLGKEIEDMDFSGGNVLRHTAQITFDI